MQIVRGLALLVALSIGASPVVAQVGGGQAGAMAQAPSAECVWFSCLSWESPWTSGFACLAGSGGLHFGVCRATSYSCEYDPCSLALRTRFDGTPVLEEMGCRQRGGREHAGLGISSPHLGTSG